MTLAQLNILNFTFLSTRICVSTILNRSYIFWLHVAKSKRSWTRFKQPKPRYGSSPFSLIYSLLLKKFISLFSILFLFYFVFIYFFFFT